jgi:hypothetical protein
MLPGMRVRASGPRSVGPAKVAWHVLCAWTGAVSLGLSPAHADSTVEVIVDCPALDGEHQAAVEARVRTDLLVKKAERGRLVLTCSADQAAAQWQSKDGVATTETATLAVPSGLVDQLLALALRATADAQVEAHRAGPKPTRPTPELVSGPVDTHAAEPPAASPTNPPTDVARQQPAGTTHLSLSLGATAEAWRGDLAGALGPRLGVGASSQQWLGLELVGALQWAPQQSEAVSATEVELAVEGRVRAYGVVWANAALGVSGLLVSTRLEQTADSDNLLVATAWAGVRAALDLGGPTLWMGPELRMHTASRLVRVHGRDVFTVPAATVGLAVGITVTP